MPFRSKWGIRGSSTFGRKHMASPRFPSKFKLNPGSCKKFRSLRIDIVRWFTFSNEPLFANEVCRTKGGFCAIAGQA